MPETTRRARAWLLGARIDVRQLESGEILAANPIVLALADGAYGVAFRFGAACVLGASLEEERAFLASLGPAVLGRFEHPEVEEVEILVQPGKPERIEPSGNLSLVRLDVHRAQVVADVLAKSTVLAHHEERVGSVFDRVEGLASELERGVRPRGRRDWLREIGGVLLTESQMVGRVEITEKPEFTWEEPELDELYERLAVEFELRDRDLALSRKLALISRSAETYLDLLHNQQSLRVEWYIVILILFEIGLTLFEYFG